MPYINLLKLDDIEPTSISLSEHIPIQYMVEYW